MLWVPNGSAAQRPTALDRAKPHFRDTKQNALEHLSPHRGRRSDIGTLAVARAELAEIDFVPMTACTVQMHSLDARNGEGVGVLAHSRTPA